MTLIDLVNSVVHALWRFFLACFTQERATRLCLTSTLCWEDSWPTLSIGSTSSRWTFGAAIKKESRSVADARRVLSVVEMSVAKVFTQLLLNVWQPFFSATRIHYAFDRFDDFQCNLFRPQTQIFPVEEVYPAPGEEPNTTCPDNWPSGWDRTWCVKCAKHQKSQPRKEAGSPPNLLTRTRRLMLASMLHFARSRNCTVYTPERLKTGRNSLCCLSGFQTFRENARAQGGGGAAGRELFRSARETCCDQFILQTSGTDALQKLCPYQKLG